MHTFSAQAMCKMRHFEDIIVIGDSISAQFSVSLANDFCNQNNNFHAIMSADIFGALLHVMNRGAHYEADNITIPTINATLHYIRNQFPSISIVRRNTIPGTLDPTNFLYDIPLKTPDPISNLYHWNEILLQKNIIRAFLEKFFPEVLYLDIGTMGRLQRNAHIDHWTEL